MNKKIGKQDCKKCIWYESCKDFEGFKRRCEDYSPVKESRRDRRQYIDDLDDRHAEYMDTVSEFTDRSEE